MKLILIVFTGKETTALVNYEFGGLRINMSSWRYTALQYYGYGWRYTFEYFVR